MEIEVVAAPHWDEERLIYEWRFDQLRRAGYDPELALDLAVTTKVDLHDATELLRRGCEPTLAARILL
jgi:hypothetical protein